MKTKDLKQLRILTLLAGTVIAWSTTLFSFANFYRLEGTIFKIKDCIVSNPVTTPCFWGAVAFLAALIWSVRKVKNERYMLYFLAFSVVFAWSNFAIELIGVQPKEGAIIAPCPADKTSPFLSPCFFGSLLFTASLVLTYLVFKRKNKSEKAVKN